MRQFELNDFLKTVLGHAVSGFIIGLSTGLVYTDPLDFTLKGVLIGGLIGALRSVSDYLANEQQSNNTVMIQLNKDKYSCTKKRAFQRKHFL
jgi:hypothetical protein